MNIILSYMYIGVCIYIDSNLHIVQNCNTTVSTHPWILYTALKYQVQEWKFCPLYDDVV